MISVTNVRREIILQDEIDINESKHSELLYIVSIISTIFGWIPMDFSCSPDCVKCCFEINEVEVHRDVSFMGFFHNLSDDENSISSPSSTSAPIMCVFDVIFCIFVHTG